MNDRSEEGGSGPRRWRDPDGTEWTVSDRRARGGMEEGWVLRSETYAFVVLAPATEQPGEDDLHGYLDGHRGRTEGGHRTARLWTDPRSRMEWEVSQDAGELVFRSGTEVVRSARGDGEKPPHEMSSEELQAELDEAESRS